MDVSIAIMASKERYEEAFALYYKLIYLPFSKVVVVWDENHDEWDTGVRSWQDHDDSDWHVVIQDDAIIGDSFYNNLTNALLHVPEPSLVSFYTGTVRPIQERVAPSVAYAKSKKVSWLTDNYLHWGVCAALPTELIQPILDDISRFDQYQYDNRLGYYFGRRGRTVYYSMPSIVDHNDDLPSLTGHDLGTDKRVAHWFVGDEAVTWNKKTRRIE